MTYEVATEKVLRRSVKKGYITKEEAAGFSEKLFEQLNIDFQTISNAGEYNNDSK